ncbi:hypothetical protein [Cryptosporangium aurantiacum]|uniref:Uncharacterized protein n=1 Tax=Cryptosporangium aurantiacum TaxID=134849 RepID=A0A1M7TUJ7_9ACTN|nr:hypothetical protein [Cryptosporangium aurantiacum]SHN74336.1 hypothetical protein SAMN05443668_10761 [Cryptosporangium aurantiacum]
MSAYLLAVVLLGYAGFQVARRAYDSRVVPHWTTAAAAGTGALLLEGYALTAVLGSSLDWTYQVITFVLFALIAPTTIAWAIVGSLWLRHRAREAAPGGAHRRTAESLMNAPTQRMRHI